VLERFTRVARDVVVDARRQARTLDHQVIGTPHLLLALLAADDSTAREALAAQGVTAEAVERELDTLLRQGPTAAGTDGAAKAAAETGPSDEQADEQALTALGIDVARIREAIEASFGPGALDRVLAEQAPRPRGGVLSRLGLPRGRRGQRGTERTELDALRHPSSRGATRPAFSPAARKTLELTLREALRLGDGQIDDDHLLLGLLRCTDGVAAGILIRLGADPAALRQAIEGRHRRSA
jgi:ATP-dependent Clp protease ATP-binding subunit ClpA